MRIPVTFSFVLGTQGWRTEGTSEPCLHALTPAVAGLWAQGGVNTRGLGSPWEELWGKLGQEGVTQQHLKVGHLWACTGHIPSLSVPPRKRWGDASWAVCWVCVCLHLCVHVCTCIYLCICVHICVHVCASV